MVPTSIMYKATPAQKMTVPSAPPQAPQPGRPFCHQPGSPKLTTFFEAVAENEFDTPGLALEI